MHQTLLYRYFREELKQKKPRPRSGGCAGGGGPRGATPRSRSGGAAMRRYPSSKVRSSGKEIQPVRSKGDQPWVFIGRTDAEAETAILWPPDEK